MITGDIGTGKTTLCRALLEQIDRNDVHGARPEPVPVRGGSAQADPAGLRRGVARRREAGPAGRREQAGADRRAVRLPAGLLPFDASAVLIIDEAQNLPLQVLEQIRILSNLETDKEKLLQIILVGQLNLQPLLRSPEMRQLDQRVSIRYETAAADREDAAAYVSHRLMIAGGSQRSRSPRRRSIWCTAVGGSRGSST